jgi:hypothetical protein
VAHELPVLVPGWNWWWWWWWWQWCLLLLHPPLLTHLHSLLAFLPYLLMHIHHSIIHLLHYPHQGCTAGSAPAGGGFGGSIFACCCCCLSTLRLCRLGVDQFHHPSWYSPSKLETYGNKERIVDKESNYEAFYFGGFIS